MRILVGEVAVLATFAAVQLLFSPNKARPGNLARNDFSWALSPPPLRLSVRRLRL